MNLQMVKGLKPRAAEQRQVTGVIVPGKEGMSTCASLDNSLYGKDL